MTTIPDVISRYCDAAAGDQEYLVTTHFEGDSPGGVVDLDQRFTLSDGLIADLSI